MRLFKLNSIFGDALSIDSRSNVNGLRITVDPAPLRLMRSSAWFVGESEDHCCEEHCDSEYRYPRQFAVVCQMDAHADGGTSDSTASTVNTSQSIDRAAVATERQSGFAGQVDPGQGCDRLVSEGRDERIQSLTSSQLTRSLLLPGLVGKPLAQVSLATFQAQNQQAQTEFSIAS